MKIRIRNIIHKLGNFLKDENAGSLLEYGLLIGFSIFIFIIIIQIILSMFDWTSTQISQFFNQIG
ncbi:MAG: hypothetical protein KAX33_01815 [Candidatus Lokiarchaeota archaeon]|nr:hypothetical protein [Candidatus Lokiarchaeota archaeon]